MLAYILALGVGFGSFALYLVAFFLPEVYRKQDFFWSGVGLFYALVLWVCADRITGGLLLGEAASVALLGWLGWQMLQLRRQVAEQQTLVPSAAEMQESVANLANSRALAALPDQLKQQLAKLKTAASQPSEAIAIEEPYVPLTRADFAVAASEATLAPTASADTVLPTAPTSQPPQRSPGLAKKNSPLESSTSVPVDVPVSEMTSAAEIPNISVETSQPERAQPSISPANKARPVEPANPGRQAQTGSKAEPKPAYVRKKYRTPPETAAELVSSQSPTQPPKPAQPNPPKQNQTKAAADGKPVYVRKRFRTEAEPEPVAPTTQSLAAGPADTAARSSLQQTGVPMSEGQLEAEATNTGQSDRSLLEPKPRSPAVESVQSAETVIQAEIVSESDIPLNEPGRNRDQQGRPPKMQQIQATIVDPVSGKVEYENPAED